MSRPKLGMILEIKCFKNLSIKKVLAVKDFPLI